MPGDNRRNLGKKPKGASAGGGISSTNLPGPAPHEGIAGDPQTLIFLNNVLRNELTAINQYFLHSRMLSDWGLSELAHKEYEESIDEMKHADKLIKRVLFLGGLPNLQDLGKLLIGENVHELITCDLSLEVRSLPDLKLGITHCETMKDFGTRELFVDILKSEEEHIDWLQTQLRLIEQMSIENFVQLQTKPNATVS
jgi:bacterioferritin